MATTQGQPRAEAALYRLHVREGLPAGWSAWLEGAAIAPQADGSTAIEATLVDQAALYGLISRLRDLGLTLLAVERLGPARPER